MWPSESCLATHLTCSDRRRVFHAFLSDRMAVAMMENISVTMIPVWKKHKVNCTLKDETAKTSRWVEMLLSLWMKNLVAPVKVQPLTLRQQTHRQHLKQHRDPFIIATTRWRFDVLYKWVYTKSRVTYVKRAAATTSRTSDQGNQNPKIILKTTMTHFELMATWYLLNGLETNTESLLWLIIDYFQKMDFLCFLTCVGQCRRLIKYVFHFNVHMFVHLTLCTSYFYNNKVWQHKSPPSGGGGLLHWCKLLCRQHA